VLRTTAAGALALLAFGASPGAVQLAEPDRQRLVAHLEMTAAWLADEVSGLTAAQVQFRRAPGAWTIVEVVDHLVVVGPIYWKDLQAAIEEPAGGRTSQMTDADVLWYGIDRSWREQAIPTELPAGRVRDVAAALDEFRTHHNRLLQYIRTTRDDLRRHYVRRQRSDAYQWALLISTHVQRHILQIREIKADPKYPKGVTAPPKQPVGWGAVLDQPAAWYGSPAARAIADSVLAWQLGTGAWPKNIDMTKPPAPGAKPGDEESTIDNRATVTQIRLLGLVYRATSADAYLSAGRRGIEYLLRAQYPNGGWPQYFPLRKGYYTHITFNDDAMAGTLMLLWDVADGSAAVPPFDDALRARARTAVDRGIGVILKTQIRVNDPARTLTAWCQQHDEVTLEPRPARTFEPVALVSAESVGLVRVLMRLPNPPPPVVEAIDAAVAWLRAVRIDGTDRWARFYQLGTNRPIFAGRDAVVRYRVEEIEEERQKGYSWYGDYAATLLSRDYPAWKERTTRARR
jgi:PelA/Pel-15E family pectate lyase